MWQYQEMPPARGVISPRAMAQTVIRACVWASNFTTLLSRWGFVIDLPGQLELAPVGQWLLAIDVLADTDRVDGLGGVQAVRGRDADDVDVGVGRERFVLHVHLGPAGLLAGGLESGTVDVADRNGRGLALLLETVDDVQVRLGSSPGADEADAKPIVGPLASGLRMVKPGTSAAVPAVPRKSRRVVPAPSSPVICLGVSRIFVLLEKRRNRATSPPARGGAGISVVFRQVGFCGERPGHREPTVIIEACRIPWGSSTP